MKNSRAILIAVSTWLLLSTMLSLVSANTDVQFIFNNGFTTSPGASCTIASDIAKINAVFGTRRLLRGQNIDNTTALATLTSENGRDLQTTAQKCASICQYYAPGTCRSRGCVGFRDLEDDLEKEGDRKLQTSCPVEIDALHVKLDNVMTQVSDSCRNFLAKSKRRAACFVDNLAGNILGIRLWKVSGTIQTLLSEAVGDGNVVSFCKSVPINIEAFTEPCVKDVLFEMYGPNSYFRSHKEMARPFAIFEDDGVTLKPKLLSNVGVYMLLISADFDLNGRSKTKMFQVVVNNC